MAYAISTSHSHIKDGAPKNKMKLFYHVRIVKSIAIKYLISLIEYRNGFYN